MVQFVTDGREINPQLKIPNKNTETVLLHDTPIESHNDVKLSVDAGATGQLPFKVSVPSQRASTAQNNLF